MIGLNIKTKGFNDVDKFLKKNFPKAIRQASVTSLNKTNTQIRSKSTKRISAGSGIKPQKLIRQRIGRFKANKRKLVAGTIFTSESMNVEILGDPKWNRKMAGAKVKGKQYKGSFVGVPNTGRNAGKRRVYNRVGNSGSSYRDLRPVRISLKPYEKYHLASGQKIIRNNLRKNFENNLKYRLAKRGFKI